MNRILVYGLSQDTLGGIETFLLNMNKFMSEDTVFDYVIEGTYTIHKDEIERRGGKCFFVAPKKSALSNIKDWKRLLKEQKNNYKTIYFNLYSLAWIFPITIALKQKYNVVVHAHNNNLHDCGFVQKSLHGLNRKRQNHLKIIRFTNSELSSIFFFSKKKAELIYNAIDVDRFSFNEKKRDEVREMCGVEKNQHLYGFSGRLSYQKNPFFLLDVFHGISKLDPNSKFIICGDGNLSDDVKVKAKEYELNIIFTGSVKNIEDYYQAMDTFVLPSRFEGLGLVLVEAQASGLKSYTSDNVVPSTAKITDLLDFISLDESAESWANKIVNGLPVKIDRNKYCDIIRKTNFNISKEAKRLEGKFFELNK